MKVKEEFKMALKYACITGSLGNRVDRFMAGGYKEDNTAEERIAGLAKTGVVEALELCYDPDGDENNPEEIRQWAKQYGLKFPV